MTLQAPERHSVSVADVDLVRVRFNERLDSGELLSGTPTVVEMTTTDLTLSNKGLNTSSYTDNEGNTVLTSQAVQFLVAGGTVAHSPYLIKITVSTNSTPIKTLNRYISLSFV